MFIKFFLKSQKGKDLDITCPKCYECKDLRPVIKNEWIESPIEYYLKTNAWDCKISGTLIYFLKI